MGKEHHVLLLAGPGLEAMVFFPVPSAFCIGPFFV